MLNEELKKEKNRELFRQLVKKYHPDLGGDKEITRKLIASRISDIAFEKFVEEVINKQEPKKEPSMKSKIETSNAYKDALRDKIKEQTKWFNELNLKNVSCEPRIVLDPKAYYIDFRMTINRGNIYQSVSVFRSEMLFNKEKFIEAVIKVIINA